MVSPSTLPSILTLLRNAEYCSFILPQTMDVAARTLIAPQDLPIGIATAAIGGLFFILLLRRRS